MSLVPKLFFYGTAFRGRIPSTSKFKPPPDIIWNEGKDINLDLGGLEFGADGDLKGHILPFTFGRKDQVTALS